ncbi:MAG: prenyltransferase/squalene oxidase repeat-containing protein [Planctomycetota bacterium]
MQPPCPAPLALLCSVWSRALPSAAVGLWVALAASAVGLVLLFRTRWRGAKAWHRCAALSLWVHLLLACVATTIRIVSGAGGDGSDAPIRIAMLPDEALVEEEEEADEAPPLADWEQPVEEPVVMPEPTPPEPVTAEELEEVLEEIQEAEPEEEAPAEEMPAEEPESEPEAVEQTEEQQTADDAVELPADADEAEPESPPEQSGTASTNKDVNDGQEPVNPLRPRPDPVVPSQYADRFAADRLQRAARRGGSPQTERAVRKALSWLASTQADSGGWVAARHGAGVERVVLGHNRNGAGANADTGVTGLALLAFLGGGSTHESGPYAENIDRGLAYLRGRQRADGSLYGDAQVFAQTYCHSMASLAALEAMAVTGDDQLRPMCERAVRYSLSLQHPSDGGWRYLRGHAGDTSQLGWQLMGLKTAQLAGVDVPSVTWTRVERFLRSVRRGSAGGLAAYQPVTRASRTMTAEALYCRQLLAGNASAVAPAVTKEAVDSLLVQPPGSGRANFYYWYYATLALESASDASVDAELAWRRWNRALTAALTTTQQADGGWGTDTAWGGYGGRVYTTAMAALCLEVYYRYSPDDSPGVAERRGWEAISR